MLHDGRISWASRKDKNVNDGNSYLLKSRNGKRKRNMVDVLSFDARETKDTKNDSLYKTLRLFDLSYSVFARLEWLGIPETKSIPISVKDKSLRMPEGNVAVTCVEGCEREAEGMRGTLKDVGVPSGGKVDVRIVVIHDAEHYKAQVRSEGDANDAAVYGYFFAVPREEEDGRKGADGSFGGRYVYLHICGDGRFEYYGGSGQPSFDMMVFAIRFVRRTI